LKDLLKFTQIGIFGLKKYHLATLEKSRSATENFHYHRSDAICFTEKQGCQIFLGTT
jgi:hypothetical protein